MLNNMPLVPSAYWNMVHGFTAEDVKKDLEGLMEIAGLQGSVTRMNGEVYPHLHVTLAGQDNKVHAGHVIGLIVGATCEMFVRVLDGEVSRERDEEIGINIIRF